MNISTNNTMGDAKFESNSEMEDTNATKWRKIVLFTNVGLLPMAFVFGIICVLTKDKGEWISWVLHIVLSLVPIILLILAIVNIQKKTVNNLLLICLSSTVIILLLGSTLVGLIINPNTWSLIFLAGEIAKYVGCD